MAKKAASNVARQAAVGPLGGVLNIHTEEDRKPVGQRDGNRYGVAEGLNITHFLNELFYNNYEAQLSDEEMNDIVAAEYPNRPSWQNMAAYRGYFNGGKHGHGMGDGLPLTGDNRLVRFKSQAELDEDAAKKEAAKTRKAAKKVEGSEEQEAPVAAAPKRGGKPAAPATAAPAARPAGRQAAAPAVAGRAGQQRPAAGQRQAPAAAARGNAPAGKPAGNAAPAQQGRPTPKRPGK